MNKIRNKIAKLFYKIFNMLENNGVSDFKTNGEDIFLDFIIKSYKGNNFYRILLRTKKVLLK